MEYKHILTSNFDIANSSKENIIFAHRLLKFDTDFWQTPTDFWQTPQSSQSKYFHKNARVLVFTSHMSLEENTSGTT